MTLENILSSKTKEEIHSVLLQLLTAYTQPAFGALPKREIDLIFFDAILKLLIVPQNPTVYDIARSLKVTRTKARSLFYDYESRVLDRENLHARAIDVLKSPILQKQGNLFVLEIDNPVVSDYLQNIFRQEGHASDGSFSPSLVKISLNAFVNVTQKMLEDKQRAIVKKSLIKAGAPDGSFTGVLKGALKTLGMKLADGAGESCAENISAFIEPLWNGTAQNISELFSNVYKK